MICLPSVIERRAEIPADTVFWFWGRPLRIIRCVGNDAAAPVIVEELTDDGLSIKGQLGLWSLDSVRMAMAGGG